MTVRQRLAKIDLLLLDVDGVLTDGRVVIDDHGTESKFFDVRDGHGLKLLQRAGVAAGLVTGRRSRVVELRAAELGIDEVHQGVKDKLSVVRRILKHRGLRPEQVGYVGDDVVDLPVMLQVGAAIAVADAHSCVRERAHWVTDAAGGRGAVREVCDALLVARGCWEEVTQRYFQPAPLLPE